MLVSKKRINAILILSIPRRILFIICLLLCVLSLYGFLPFCHNASRNRLLVCFKLRSCILLKLFVHELSHVEISFIHEKLNHPRSDEGAAVSGLIHGRSKVHEIRYHLVNVFTHAALHVGKCNFRIHEVLICRLLVSFNRFNVLDFCIVLLLGACVRTL